LLWVFLSLGPSLPHSIFGFLLREPSRHFGPRIELRNVLTVPSSLDDSDALSICRSPGLHVAFLFFSLMYVYHKKNQKQKNSRGRNMKCQKTSGNRLYQATCFRFLPNRFSKNNTENESIKVPTTASLAWYGMLIQSVR